MARKEEELLLSVADVVLVELIRGEEQQGVEYATASLKSHNISQTVDTSEIRAGRKNAVIATLESNKTITVEIEDVHANREWLAIAMDGKIESSKKPVEVRVLPQKITVPTTLDIKLAKAPNTETINIVVDGVQKEVEVSEGVISAEAHGAAAGKVIEVMSYKHNAAAADIITIGGEGQGRAFAMYLEESVFNNDMKVIATKTTYFPRVVPESSFSMSGSSELAEQNMTYTFTVTQAEGKEFLGQVFYVAEKTEDNE